MISFFITAVCHLVLFQKLIDFLIFFLRIFFIKREIRFTGNLGNVGLLALEEFFCIGINLIKCFPVSILVINRVDEGLNVVAQCVAFDKIRV